MTSSNQTENVDNFEEGEILDDDDNPSIVQDVRNLKRPVDSTPIFNKLFRCGNGRRTSNVPSSFSFDTGHHPSGSDTRRREPPGSNARAYCQKRGNIQRRLCLRDRRKRAFPRFNTPKNRRQVNNFRDRSRGGTPYEDKLKDFQMRLQKIRSSSNSEEKKQPRTMVTAGLTEISNTGTSLLKRLVGSGSVGIRECTNGPVSESPLGQYGPEGSQATAEHESEAKKILGMNENLSDTSLDPDDELIKLRMEALKTAVLKKHSERLKRGYVPKKSLKDTDDPIVDSFIDDVETLDEFDSVDVPTSPYSHGMIRHDITNNGQSDNSDMSMDSNNVSDDDVLPKNSLSSVEIGVTETEKVPRLKRAISENSTVNKKLKLKESSQNNGSENTDSIISDLNDEELQLRALALKSFLQRKGLKDSDSDSDKVSIKSELLVSEIKGETAEEIVLKQDKNEVTSRNRSDSENWEELDEDILRAQLLKTLSASLPVRTPVKEILQDEIDLSQTVMKPSTVFLKKETDSELELQSKLWSEMMVPKLVISLVSDSESEPESSSQDFVKSLDLLLQEAKEKSEKKPAKEEPKPKIKKKIANVKNLLKKPIVKRGSSMTPVAVKHLSIQQQEEYRQLKMKLEKLKSNKLKSSSNVSPITLVTQSPVSSRMLSSLPTKGHPSTHDFRKLDIVDSANPKRNVALKQNQNTAISKPYFKTVNVTGTVVHKKSNVLIIGEKPCNKITGKIGKTIAPKSQADSCLGIKVANRADHEVNSKVDKTKTIPPSSKSGINTKSKMPAALPHGSKTVSCSLVNKIVKTDLEGAASKTDSHGASSNKDALEARSNDNTELKVILRASKEDKPNPDSSTNRLINVDDKSVSKFSTVTIVKKESGTAREHDKVDFVNKQGGQDCVNSCGTLINPPVKENEGNSDKENEIVGAKDANLIAKSEGRRDQEIAERLSEIGSEVSDISLSEKLKDAESKFEETYALVSRLERELEEAKVALAERGETVEELKGLIKGCKETTALSVKVSDNVPLHEKGGNGAESLDAVKSSSTEGCWDPDVVLCPYQLAGCCKDPLCSFHHICS